MEDITSIASDGEPKNTGPDGGANHKFQDKLGRPLTHIICVLHCIERLMRKAVEEIGKKIEEIVMISFRLV